MAAESVDDSAARPITPSLSTVLLRDESALASFLRSEPLDEARILARICSFNASAGAAQNSTADPGRTNRRWSWPLGQHQARSVDTSSLRVFASTTSELDRQSETRSVATKKPKGRVMKLRLELDKVPVEDELRFVGAWTAGS